MMDNLLMTLGFTESKEDSKLYYKFEDGNPVILLLYVDDLFVAGTDGLVADTKRKLAAEFEMKDLDMMRYFYTREVCSIDPEQVQDDGLQGHDHTYGIEPEAIE